MSGRAVILSTSTVISPFGEPARDAFFADQTIAETQDFAFRSAGMEVVRVDDVAAARRAVAEAGSGPVLLLLDRVYMSEKAAKDFLRATRQSARPAALALSINASVDYTLPLQDVLRDGERVVHSVLRVDGAELPDGEDAESWLRALRAAATAVEVPKREIVIPVPLPTIGERGGSILRYPVTSTVVVSIEHWVHVLWLNQIAFGIRWMELIRRRPLWAAWRAIGALSIDPERLLERLVARGRGARLHPTAYVSGSILGRDVKIGAQATVRNSIVGDGVVIQDHAVVLNSVIGARSLVTENTFFVSGATYPEATLGNYKLQVSLIGRGAYVNAWAGFVDAKFVGHVKVEHGGRLVSTERAFLGSVVGHRAKVAAKVLIHPGREIPNDAVIVMRPDEVVSVVPDRIEPGRPMVRHAGTLVPLGEEGAPR